MFKSIFQRILEGAGVFHINIDDTGTKANLNKEEHAKILEEVAYREMPGAKLDAIGRLDKVAQDPLGTPAAQKPFIIQNSPAQKGSSVKARMIEPVFNQDLETASNTGRVRTELMRNNEDEPDFSSIQIPNYLYRYGQGMDDVEEIEVWTEIAPRQVLDMQRARGYGLSRWAQMFTTLLFGYSPGVMRANLTAYPASLHTNILWGTAFGGDYTHLEESLTGDLPSMDVAESLAYETKRMKLPPVNIGGRTYKAAYWCDFALWSAWRRALHEVWKDINIADKDHPLHGYNIGVWAGILFIDHGWDPVTPKKWNELTTTTEGAGDAARTILNFSALDLEDVPQDLGGPSAFSAAFVTGAGAVRINDGGSMIVKHDDASEYENREAGWVGQVNGMKRADRVLNSDGTTHHNASFLHILRRYKHQSES